jgi:hypothetical protein
MAAEGPLASQQAPAEVPPALLATEDASGRDAADVARALRTDSTGA